MTGKDKIGLAVGKVVNRYKMAKHLDLNISDAAFSFSRRRVSILAETALDGLYVIRTSLLADQMDAADWVRGYQNLSRVEWAFRTIKTVDLKVCPIHHRLAGRVRSPIFLCMLAYYVEWRMREAWRALTFADEHQDVPLTRDPVAPATR